MNRKILTGKEAQVFFHEDTEHLLANLDNHKTEPNIGGWWKEGSLFLAFDTTNGWLYAEEFSIEDEAIKYANGKMAKTAGGMLI